MYGFTNSHLWVTWPACLWIMEGNMSTQRKPLWIWDECAGSASALATMPTAEPPCRALYCKTPTLWSLVKSLMLFNACTHPFIYVKCLNLKSILVNQSFLIGCLIRKVLTTFQHNNCENIYDWNKCRHKVDYCQTCQARFQSRQQVFVLNRPKKYAKKTVRSLS